MLRGVVAPDLGPALSYFLATQRSLRRSRKPAGLQARPAGDENGRLPRGGRNGRVAVAAGGARLGATRPDADGRGRMRTNPNKLAGFAVADRGGYGGK